MAATSAQAIVELTSPTTSTQSAPQADALESGKQAEVFLDGRLRHAIRAEKKARVEDALHATRAAVEEGVVPGGGVALIRALSAISGLKGANEDQNHGITIALRAMEAPLREIVTNCGEEPSVVLNNVKQGTGSYGYNAATGEYGDMIAMGILDPTKVTRTALQNAAISKTKSPASAGLFLPILW